MPVFLDAGGVEAPLSSELLQHITVLSPNETELARLSAMPTDTLEQVAAAAQALQVRCVGPAGAVWALSCTVLVCVRLRICSIQQSTVNIQQAATGLPP